MLPWSSGARIGRANDVRFQALRSGPQGQARGKTALELVAPNLRKHITSLLEIVEWRKRQEKPTLSSHLDTAFKDLTKRLQWYPRCFLDARELTPEGPTAARRMFRRAAAAGIPFVPVTGISNRVDTSAAMGNRNRGLAIRLTREDFEVCDLTSSLPTFMKRHGIGFADTDLIVDLGPAATSAASHIARGAP